MNILANFNLFEAIFWFILSISIFIFGVIREKIVVGKKNVFIFLSLTLFLFGVSDLIEVKTGAWWQPIWLLLFKGACIIGIIISICLLVISSKN